VIQNPLTRGISPQLLLQLKQAEAQATIDCVGVDLIKNDAQGQLALALLLAYGDSSDGFLYFEPCTCKSSSLPPDAVLCTGEVGVLVIECKGYAIDDIHGVKAGSLSIRTRGRIRYENPIDQVRNAMFAIKDRVERLLRVPHGGPLFSYLVTLPRVTKAEWASKNYDECLPAGDLLLMDELDSRNLRAKILAKVKHGLEKTRRKKGADVSEIQTIKIVFGDSDIINPPTPVEPDLQEGTLGLIIARNDVDDKHLSEDQKSLSGLRIGGFPRVIRGVAGSGKTVVLAIQAARYVAANMTTADLFSDDNRSIGIVCFNRSLVPMLRRHVQLAYRQRTQEALPSGVRINHINGLMYRLITTDKLLPLEYVKTPGTTGADRANAYLAQIAKFADEAPEHYSSVLLDAIFVDEGQDLEVEEFALLLSLLKPDPVTGEKTLVIFYDDAQNLYARKRPVWKDLGIDVQRGDRSRVMKECFRNTTEIVELAFNVLLGTASVDPAKVQTRAFSNVAELKQAGLVEEVAGYYLVKFTERRFDKPVVKEFRSREEERNWISMEVFRLITEEQVRPEHILILCPTIEECKQLQSVMSSNMGQTPQVKGFRRPYVDEEKDEFIFQDGHLTISTTNSAKGYDAQIVLMAATDRISTEPDGRASFYVSATRAKLLLYITGLNVIGTLLQEAQKLHDVVQ
jgi:superfamily I DNA and RNA helicase